MGAGGGGGAGYRRSVAEGASLSFAFEGSRLTLVPGPDDGEVSVRLDGKAFGRVSLNGEPVQLARGWRQKRHDVTLSGVNGVFSVDELIVESPWRPSRGSVLGAVGVVVLLGWLSTCIRHRR